MVNKNEKIWTEKMWTQEEIQTLKDKYDNLTKNSNTDTAVELELEMLKEEAKDFVNDFKTEFYNRYGVIPAVMYKFSKDNYYPMSLEELEEICNNFMENRDGFKSNIRNKSRKRNIVQMRQIFFYLGIKVGYGFTELGKYLTYDHATVIHSAKTVENLIDIDDQVTIRILKHVNDEIAKRTVDGFYSRRSPKKEPVS